MLIKALEKIIINGTIVDAGETYDGTAEELADYISGGYVDVLEQDEKPDEDPEEDREEDEEPEKTPKEKPKTTRRAVRRTKKTGE